jgi:hypothetical protein
MPITGQRASTSPAARTARRDGPAAPTAAAAQGFRLEPERLSADGAAAARPAAITQEKVDPGLPADVLVARGEAPSAGLDVTIAAATPDLRDRFRAAVGELQAELTSIGTEVDAIRVELRADLADGSSGGSASDGPARDTNEELTTAELADATWGEPYAAVRPDLGEPGADGAAERHGTEADASAAVDGDTDGAADRPGSDRRDQPDPEAATHRERLRVLLGPPGARMATEGSANSQGRVDMGQPRRIDRYA